MADSRDGGAFHLTGDGAEVFLQSPDICCGSNELVTGSDGSLKDMLLTEFGNCGVEGKTGRPGIKDSGSDVRKASVMV